MSTDSISMNSVLPSEQPFSQQPQRSNHTALAKSHSVGMASSPDAPGYVFRSIQSTDRDRVKELHEEWFPVV